MSRIVVAGPGYGASIRRKTASSGNGLLNNLVAYWPLNEVSGDALDLHTNGLTLADNYTVTSNTGKVYALARQYTAAIGEYHNRASEALIQMGDVEFTLVAWCYGDSFANYPMIISKGSTEYRIYYWTASGPGFEFQVGNGSTTIGTVRASTFGAASTSVWYFVAAWHDPTENKVYIQINNGAINSAATSGPAGTGATALEIAGTPGSSNYWNGRIGPVAIWKSAAGGGGVLTAAQRTALYNGDAGLAYAAFTL